MLAALISISIQIRPDLVPYAGPTPDHRVVESLHGNVMAGYQGWFMAKGDGFEPGFVHWGGVDREPPTCTVDMWPDLTEYGAAEKFPTNFRHKDGSTAHVFSSTVKETVVRHFDWMRQYDIDGAFVQRFAVTINPDQPNGWQDQRTNRVLSNCREAANRSGRGFAVMYDTDFDRATCERLMKDWSRLVGQMKILETNSYMHHAGGPVVSLWGFGFDHRKFDAKASRELFQFLKKPENGACTIMLGVPNDWRSWTDERIDLIKEFCTVVSPWNVGRYGNPEQAAKHFERFWPGDLEFCKEEGKDYYPVVFPGFSWTNLRKFTTPLNQIPRMKGKFLWSQFELVKKYGMDMAYVAMFDEVDEGTAIFKVTNDPPVGQFVTYEGLPSDAYLQITQSGRNLLKGRPAQFPFEGSSPNGGS
jgi:hypothetical protein